MTGWAAVLPLLGVVVGATLQYWTSRSAEARKQLQLLRSQSYVDYLRAVTKAAYATSPDAGRLAKAEAADAKARMSVCRTSRTIAALIRIEEAGPVLDTPNAQGVYAALVTAMRDGDSPSQSDLELVLFGKQ